MQFRYFFPYEEPLPIIITFSQSGNIIPETVKVSEKELTASSNLDVLLRSVCFGASVFRPIFNPNWINLCKSPDIIESKNKLICEALPCKTALEKKLNCSTLKNKKMIDKKLQQNYFPYYEAITKRVTDLKKIFPDVIILDIYAFSSKKNDLSISIEKLNEKNIDPILHHMLSSRLIDSENLKLNKKIKSPGSNIIEHFGNSKDGVHAVQVGLSNNLLLDTNVVNNYSENNIQMIMRVLIFLLAGGVKGLSDKV